MKKLAFISVLVVVIGICFTVRAFADFYVIPVNNKCGPCKGTRSSGGRWCDNGDGTVTDMTTCLVWLKYAGWGGIKFWWYSSGTDDAHNRAGILESGETISPSGETPFILTDDSVVGDWRLPTKTELSGIINEGGETVSYSNMQLFQGMSGSFHWSSTSTPTHSGYAYTVHMTTGVVGSHQKDFQPKSVWPVRLGN